MKNVKRLAPSEIKLIPKGALLAQIEMRNFQIGCVIEDSSMNLMYSNVENAA